MSTVILLSACGSKPNKTVVVAEGSTALPTETLTDLVTYGDYLVRMTAVSIERIPAPDEEVGRGEGTIGRQVTLQVDREAMWMRPGAERLRLPATLTVANGGWVFHGREEQQMRIEGQTVMELGEDYASILTFGDVSIVAGDGSGVPEWFVLETVLLRAGVVQTGSDRALTPALESMSGRSVADAAELLSTTPSDPAARPFMDEDPVLRYQKARAAR